MKIAIAQPPPAVKGQKLLFFRCLKWSVSDLNASPAGAVVQPVADGNHGAVLTGALQSIQNSLFCSGVQVCGNFIQQQDLRPGCNGARDGKQLPLPLREDARRTRGIVPFGQRRNGIMQAHGVENRQTEMLSTLHSSIPHLKFALQNIGKPSDVVSISGTLKITNIEQEILLGGRYWIIPNLPDIKQSDFIKAISAIIGTFPLFTESNGLVFVSFDTIMSNKAKALDWTRRLVATYKDNKPNAIAYSLDDFSQKNFYRWKEDDTVVGKYDGYLFVENETIESERDVVELPFAASDQFSDVAKIPIYSYDEEGNLEYNSVEPRLLAYNGVKGVFTGLDWNTLLSMYYQTYQSIIRRPIVITEKIEINDIELRDLDMTVPIYLAQYGRYYAIISIKAEDTGICECKLLQLEV